MCGGVVGRQVQRAPFAAKVEIPTLKQVRLATGDELVLPGESPVGSQIVGSNGLSLDALITACGGVPIDLGIGGIDPGHVVGAGGRRYLYSSGGQIADLDESGMVALDELQRFVTAGVARKPGMSRDDLISTNAGIVKNVTREVASRSPEAVIIIVSNPLDAMCHVAFDACGFPKERVIGMAGVLDSARFRAFISMELDVSVENTHAFVLGGHGDTMVPMLRHCTIAGIPIERFLSQDKIDAIIERTRKGGAEILALRQNSSAFDAPAASVVEMVDAVVHNRNRILPTVCFLDGEYGLDDIAIGVPAVLGRNGVEDIIQLDFNKTERTMFSHSASLVREDVDMLKSM